MSTTDDTGRTAGDEPAGNRVRRRRWRRRCALLVVAAGAVLAALHLPPARERVRLAAISAARDRLDTALTIGRLDYNLLTLTFTLRDLTAAATRHGDSPFFRAESVTVALTPGTLVGRLAFRSIDIARPRLSLTRDGEGRYRLPSRRGGGRAATPRLRIGRLTVSGLDVQIDGAPPMTIEAHDVSAALVQHGALIQGRLRAVNGTRFRSPAGTLVEIGVDGMLGLQPDLVSIGPLVATMSGSRVSVEGRLPFAPGPARLDLEYDGTVSLADAAAVWPAIGAARGLVSASGTLAGPLADLTLTFDATTAAPSVRGIAVTGATAKGSLGRGAITLTSATIDAAGGRVTGAASIGIRADTASTASARWQRLDLEELLRALGVPHPFPLEARMDGEASFAWDARGLESLSITAGLTASAAPRIAGLKAHATPITGTAALRLAAGAWTIALDQRLGGASSISGRLAGMLNGSAFGATSVGGRVAGSIAAADLAHTLRAMPSVPEGVRAIADRLSGDIAVTAGLSGVARDPVFAAAIEAPSVHAEGIGWGALRAGARIDRRGAAFDTLSATLAETTIRASGTVPFDGRPVDLAFGGEVGDVAAWLDAVPERWRPSGSASVSGRVTGALSALAVDGAASSTSLAWPFWKPGLVEGDVHLAEGRAQVSARVPSVNGTVRGGVALSSPADYDVIARVDGADLQRLADIAAGLGGPRAAWTGAATLSAHVAGVADGDRPLSVDVRAESLSGTVDGRAIRLIEPARMAVSGDRLSADRLRLEVGGSSITASGSLPAGADESPLRVEAHGDIADWWPAAAGRIHAAFDAGGSLRQPTLSGEATLDGATLGFPGYPPFTAIAAKARVANDTMELVEARGAWSGAWVSAHGRMPVAMLRESGGFARGPRGPSSGLVLHAAVGPLTEKALEPWLGRDGTEQLRGQVSAEIDIEASSLAFDALRGTAVIAQSDTTLAGLTVTQPRPARVRIDSGRIHVDEAAWTMGARSLALHGSVDVRGDRPQLDVALAGDVDLSLARVFVPLALSGTATIDARATGDVRRPVFAGGATLAGVSLGIPSPRVAISGVSGRLTLEKDRLVVAAGGGINGGTLELSGSLPLHGTRSGTASAAEGLRARGTGFLLEWPEGLRSTVDADLTYRLDANGGIVAGAVTVEPGAYRRTAPPTFSKERGRRAGAVQPAPAPSLLDATRLDVTVTTRAPGLIDNSYARVEMETHVRVAGTIGQPAVSGRLSVRENGEVYLRGNVFRIERGTLEFNPDPRGKPSVNLLARTRRSGYDIRLRMTGPMDTPQVVLTSDPPLAQPDLMALITTGSTSNSMSPGAQGSGSSQDMLVAAISSDILGVAGRTVGLDSVRVGELDLDLMGDDVDPQTRLTIGKSIGSWLDLLLSQNLRESGFAWAVTVHPFGSVAVRFVSRDSESTSVQVAHEVTFGRRGAREAPSAPPAEKATPRVADVTVSGGGLPAAEVVGVTEVHRGDRFDFFEWQRDRERIEALLHERGFLQALVSSRREPVEGNPGGVALRYEIRPGPVCTLRFSGFTLPDHVVAEMKAAWTRSVDDRFLHDDLVERARGALIDAGHLWPEVSVEITSAGEPEKTADVRIAAGARAADRRIVFEGRRAVSDRDLRDEIVRTGAAAKAWREPASVAAAVEAFYRRRGFLAARVSPKPIVLDGGTARLPIAITEGRRHLVSMIGIHGAAGIPDESVRGWLGWRAGDPYDPGAVAEAGKRVEAGCVGEGYRRAQATVTGLVDPATALVQVRVDVQPGTRSVVGEVQVVGRGETREGTVRRAIDLPPGAAASPAAVDRAQRRLYETEAFRSVDVTLEPIAGPAPAPAAAAAGGAPPREQPQRVVVRLEEAPLYRLRYGFQVTSDLAPATDANDVRLGVSAELRRRNLFGTGLTAGVGGRYEVGNYSARAALSVPSSVLWPSLSTLYFKQSLSTDETETGAVKTYETSVTYQERWRLGQKSELSYGYAFIREDLQNAAVVGLAEGDSGPTHRANLFAALAWDRRDSAFDATKGWFHSSSLEYGAPAIASDFSYLRYLFQQTGYRRIGPLVLAGAARVGVLVHVTGDDNETYSLRFRTGGDRTVRGYAQDSLSALGESGAMVGGRGLLVVNGEVRFPVWGWLKAATFLDAGNAFATPADISFAGLEVGAGFGIRLDTPYALFRLDLGFPLPQHTRPIVSRWYFSIGQAF